MSEKLKVLLVEDDEELAELFRHRLDAEGFSTTVCHSGEKALQDSRSLRPDLILLDIMMPQMDGFTTLDLLRHTPETQHAKIVVLSALNGSSDIDKAKSLGADDFIVKSQVVISDVMDRLRAMMGLPPSVLTKKTKSD